MNIHRAAEEVHKEAKRHTRKRKKSPSMSSVETRLDNIFSRYIRLRAADDGGTVQCVTCGKLMHWEKDGAQAGHFVRRRHRATRWRLENVNVQCVYCNKYLDGNEGEHGAYIIRTYGLDVHNDLLKLKHTTRKFTRAELEEMCNHYTQKLSELEAR